MITTATNTFIIMVQQLNLAFIVNADPVITRWYRDFFRRD
jgi:hypothetical protein